MSLGNSPNSAKSLTYSMIGFFRTTFSSVSSGPYSKSIPSSGSRSSSGQNSPSPIFAGRSFLILNMGIASPTPLGSGSGGKFAGLSQGTTNLGSPVMRLLASSSTRFFTRRMAAPGASSFVCWPTASALLPAPQSGVPVEGSSSSAMLPRHECLRCTAGMSSGARWKLSSSIDTLAPPRRLGFDWRPPYAIDATLLLCLGPKTRTWNSAKRIINLGTPADHELRVRLDVLRRDRVALEVARRAPADGPPRHAQDDHRAARRHGHEERQARARGDT